MMAHKAEAYAQIHETADVSSQAFIGQHVRIWHAAQVREGAVIGAGSILGKSVYVGHHVTMGCNCKLQNGVNVYYGARLGAGVFMGPGAMLLNDKTPRATTVDGNLKSEKSWAVSNTIVHTGASIGGGAVILPGIEIGEYAMVGAGAVVTHDVPPHGLVMGVPARLVGCVCRCGATLDSRIAVNGGGVTCAKCEETYLVSRQKGRIVVTGRVRG